MPNVRIDTHTNACKYEAVLAASDLYVLIIRMWVYIWALQTAQSKGIQMAEEPQSVCEWLDIELDKLSSDDKINLISEVCDTLTVPELMAIRDMINEKRQEKLEDAKTAVIAEMRTKIEALGLTYEDVMGVDPKLKRSKLQPKYRNPEGKEWSGRGYAPAWIRDYEEQGGDREDYLIKDEG